jgi:23S rRNA G2445 N2-methylase RlmL
MWLQTWDVVQEYLLLEASFSTASMKTELSSVGIHDIFSLSIGVDLDVEALQICQQNMQQMNMSCENIELILADATNETFLQRRPGLTRPVDVTITNPPFGTKNNAGIDIKFLQTAINMSSKAVYSFHKTSTRNARIHFRVLFILFVFIVYTEKEQGVGNNTLCTGRNEISYSSNVFIS